MTFPRFRTQSHAITVDIEEYFQVSAFENILTPEHIASLPRRVAYATHKLLDLFNDLNVKATFFTLSSVAENEKSLIQRIIQEGHELASHGIKHDRVRDLNAISFYNDILESKHKLEDISGTKIIGYRAPSFSIGKDTPFAYDMLIKAGYFYSSSIHPIQHDHYGDVNARMDIHRPIPDIQFYEFPITVLQMFGKRYPIGGGGWFRLMPFFIYQYLFSRACRSGLPFMFYTHPWEYDPDQPRIPNLPFKTKFRHYINLDKTYDHLKNLLEKYNWDRTDQIIQAYIKKNKI